MRETRPSGSEGGGVAYPTLPTPIMRTDLCRRVQTALLFVRFAPALGCAAAAAPPRSCQIILLQLSAGRPGRGSQDVRNHVCCLASRQLRRRYDSFAPEDSDLFIGWQAVTPGRVTHHEAF